MGKTSTHSFNGVTRRAFLLTGAQATAGIVAASGLLEPAALSQEPADPGEASSRSVDVTIPASRLHDQIRGGLLGHILGDLNGLPHEMKYIQEPGNVQRYVPELPEGAWTDDDTDIEWVYLLEMQRTRTLLLPMARVAELWKEHINRRIWCSHRYLRELLNIGILPPLTGSVHLNPWAGFNLSGQFACESWALISPGMPRTAAGIGTHYTHVSVEGEPIQATQFFDTMIATAFLTRNLDQLLDAGLAAIDPASQMRRAVLDIRQWHRSYPEDWPTTRRLLKEKYAIYGGDDMRDRNGVILNGASVVGALLYGKSDFTETLRLAFNFGWDADNVAATAGTIAGVIHGANWMNSQGWTIKDLFRNTSRDNMPSDETITRFGDRLIALADQVINERGGAKIGTGPEAAYRIRTEKPMILERLPDAPKQLAALVAKLKPQIAKGIERRASAKDQARAAYLAICLDLAPALKKKSPEPWQGAMRALSGFPRVMHILFYESGPAGESLRQKALAAGLEKPTQPIKLG